MIDSTPERYDELITAAAAVLRPRQLGGRIAGNVGAALDTDRGDRFTGVCVDTTCGTGWCAERAAAAAMITAGQERIARIVAVWRDDQGALFVLPPCGVCRELLRQIDGGNLETEVVLGRDEALPLRDLLPRWEWPEPIAPAPG